MEKESNSEYIAYNFNKNNNKKNWESYKKLEEKNYFLAKCLTKIKNCF